MSSGTLKPPQALDSSTWSMIRRLVRSYLRPYLPSLGAALFFMFISALMTTAFAKLIEPVLDEVLVNKRSDMVLPMAGAIFFVFCGNGLSTYFHTILMNRIGQSVVADIQDEMFSRFVGLDLSFFHENPSGQLVSRMISDVNVMRQAVADSLTGIGKSFLTLLFLVGLMFWQDWKLALIAFGIFPPAAFFVSYLGRRLRKVSTRVQSEIAGMSHIFLQSFQGMRQVKAYGMESYERARAKEAVNRVRRLYFKAIRLSNLSTPFNEILLGMAFAGVVVYGGRQVIEGDLTVGGLMSFIAAFSLAYEPLKRLAKLNNNLQTALGAAERVFDMMDRQAQITDRPGAAVMAERHPGIVFENVTFGYGYDDGHALRDASFEAPAGKVTALVGASGSGKTTAMNLVLRFYDVKAGRVLVGGHDVRDVTMDSLRRHMALVSQDITIFDETVSANIAYGRPDATGEEIVAAARAAAADDFIRALPDGYETRLGENGMNLSGGQRQRIAIARAMLRDAPILLLDEATSALDNESERLIQASLEKLQRGRTTLVIAHRLSTVQSADRIIVLEKGRIVESGRHEDLLAKDGIYARMYRLGFEE